MFNEYNLIAFYQTILNYTYYGSQAYVIYIDIFKGFDRVNHFFLSQKLNSIGISNPLLSWFTSFITKRIQIVKYKNFFSFPIYVSYGIPQWSHLYSLLVNIFLNDKNFIWSFAKLFSFLDDYKSKLREIIWLRVLSSYINSQKFQWFGHVMQKAENTNERTAIEW